MVLGTLGNASYIQGDTASLIPVGSAFEVTALWDFVLPEARGSGLSREAYGITVGNAAVWIQRDDAGILTFEGIGAPYPLNFLGTVFDPSNPSGFVFPASPDQVLMRIVYDGTPGGDVVTSFVLFGGGEEQLAGSLGSGPAEFYGFFGAQDAVWASFFARGAPVSVPEPSPGVLLVLAAGASILRFGAARAR